MLKYYLDKTGKVIKSILFPSSEFVDTEPREGSLNPVTSGGVAGSVSQQSSNFAPNYTKTTYPANSYVMQGGVLYTNPNAIGTAEDWNPAHWTQTTVAEMMAGAGDSGYTQVNLTLDMNATKTIPVGQKEDVYVECRVRASDNLIIELAEDCTDAVLTLKRLNAVKFNSFAVKRGNTTIAVYGRQIVTGITLDGLYDGNRVLLTTNYEEGDHGSTVPSLPTDFSEMELNSDTIVTNVYARNIRYDLTTSNLVNSWMFVVKGRNVLVLPG